MYKYLIVLIAIGVSMAVSGCTSKYVAGRVESGIEQRLPEIIGPAQSYKVNVEGGTGKLLRGRIARLEIVGQGVRPGGQYYLDELRVVMTGVEADTESKTIKSVDETRFTALITESSLNRYLRETRPNLRELNVDLRNGNMLVHTRPAISRISTSVNLTGDLRIVSDSKLRFVVNRLTVAGVKAPGFAADYVEDRINPVLDISGFGFPAKLETVNIRPDAVSIAGEADLTKGLPSQGR